jgi:hypothetical protein
MIKAIFYIVNRCYKYVFNILLLCEIILILLYFIMNAFYELDKFP